MTNQNVRNMTQDQKNSPKSGFITEKSAKNIIFFVLKN